MGKCVHSAVINAPVDEVWQLLRNFHDMSWTAAAESVEPVGDAFRVERRFGHPGVLRPVLQDLPRAPKSPLRLGTDLRPNCEAAHIGPAVALPLGKGGRQTGVSSGMFVARSGTIP